MPHAVQEGWLGRLTGYAFGRFSLDLQTRELLANGVPRTLERQPFELLSYLIENRDRVVSKQELNRALWQCRVVSDGALTQCAWTVRRALGDGGRGQLYIKTVSGVGYRFVSPVVEQRSSTGCPMPAAHPVEQPEATPALEPPWLLAEEAAAWLEAVRVATRPTPGGSELDALTNAALACERFARAVRSADAAARGKSGTFRKVVSEPRLVRSAR
jgi:DNA-binding winged helix-turn-helix (wHTH) protein